MTDDTLAKRFRSKYRVDKATGCWLWTASTAGKGYGQIKIPGTRRQVYAHRLSYELHRGPVPKEIMVLHTCDTPRCVNPEHLFLGTGLVNLQDMANKGRHLYGERNNQHRLKEAEVEAIHDYKAKGWTQVRIAKKFKVGQMTVSRILSGDRWRHVFLRRRGPNDPA